MTDTLVSELLRIHHAITRGMTVSIERARAFARGGFPNAETKRGFLDYVRSTVVLTLAHHDTEDDLVFPAFRARLPDVPYGELDEQHDVLLPLLDSVGAGVKAGAEGAPEREWLPALADSLKHLGEVWRAHIDIEEHHLSEEAVGGVFSPAEQEKLGREFSEHGLKLAQPGPLILPFFLFNLEPPERMKVSAKLPPEVTQHLIPVVWKETWGPMKPFLLA